jgi:hypothetical protein
VLFPLYFVSLSAVLTFSTFFGAAGSDRSSGFSLVTSLVIGVAGGLLLVSKKNCGIVRRNLFALQSEDHGLNDALALRFPLSPEVNEACHRGFQHADRIIKRAKESGQLRADFDPQDLATVIWAMSQVIRESMEVAPQAWRRCLAFFLDGLRADAAHPIEVPALTESQLARMMRAR